MYSVDRQEPKLLDVKNWKVIADICSQKHSIACEVDFFKHLRREFRVEQGEKGLLVNKQVVNKQVAENSKKAAQLVTSHFTNVAEDSKSSFCISYFMKFGTVNVFQTYSPELSIDFQIPENHLLFELPLC